MSETDHAPDDMRREAVDRAARQRNRFEYLAGGAAALLLAACAVALLGQGGTSARPAADRMIGWGFIALALGLAVAGWLLHWQSRAARRVDPALTAHDALLARLAAERDLLRSAWRWYVLPLVPGFVLIYVGGMSDPDPGMLFMIAAAALTVALLAAIVLLNRHAASAFDREIRAVRSERPADFGGGVDHHPAQGVEPVVRDPGGGAADRQGGGGQKPSRR